MEEKAGGTRHELANRRLGRRQEAQGRRHEAGGRRHKARGRRQKAGDCPIVLDENSCFF